MDTMGLSQTALATYATALRSPQRRRIRAYVTDTAGGILAPLNVPGMVQIQGGSVNCDLAADCTRTLSLTLLDRANRLSFDTNSPDDAAMYLDRGLRVDLGIYSRGLGQWVDGTIFTGPISGMSRTSNVIELSANGEEEFARGEVWRAIKKPKKMNKATAIREMLAERAGEKQFAFASTSDTLPADVNVPSDGDLWLACLDVAKSMNRQLFYTGPGVATLRTWPSTPVWAFRDGDGGDMLTPPTVTYDPEVKNVIEVTGSGTTRATAVAPADSLLSPARLGRNGVPRYLVERVQDDSLRSNAQCAARAKQILADRLLTSVDVKFDSLVIPHLDLGDMVSVRSATYGSFTFRLGSFSIPLTGGPMSVGYVSRRTISRRLRR